MYCYLFAVELLLSFRPTAGGGGASNKAAIGPGDAASRPGRQVEAPAKHAVLQVPQMKCRRCCALFLPPRDALTLRCKHCDAPNVVPVDCRRGTARPGRCQRNASRKQPLKRHGKRGRATSSSDGGAAPRNGQFRVGDDVRALWLGEDRDVYPDWYEATVTACPRRAHRSARERARERGSVPG